MESSSGDSCSSNGTELSLRWSKDSSYSSDQDSFTRMLNTLKLETSRCALSDGDLLVYDGQTSRVIGMSLSHILKPILERLDNIEKKIT